MENNIDIVRINDLGSVKITSDSLKTLTYAKNICAKQISSLLNIDDESFELLKSKMDDRQDYYRLLFKHRSHGNVVKVNRPGRLPHNNMYDALKGVGTASVNLEVLYLNDENKAVILTVKQRGNKLTYNCIGTFELDSSFHDWIKKFDLYNNYVKRAFNTNKLDKLS